LFVLKASTRNPSLSLPIEQIEKQAIKRWGYLYSLEIKNFKYLQGFHAIGLFQDNARISTHSMSIAGQAVTDGPTTFILEHVKA
jgi:hypothetical protein